MRSGSRTKKRNDHDQDHPAPERDDLLVCIERGAPVKRRPNEPTSHDLQKLKDLEESVSAKLQNIILNMPSRQLVPLLCFMNDELERRLNPPTLH